MFKEAETQIDHIHNFEQTLPIELYTNVKQRNEISLFCWANKILIKNFAEVGIQIENWCLQDVIWCNKDGL